MFTHSCRRRSVASKQVTQTGVAMGCTNYRGLQPFWEHADVTHGDYKDFFRGACDGDLELVRHYLRRGVDVDFIHPELQSTALVAAIEAGRPEVALVLLDHGADPALRSPLEGMAPLDAAEAAGLDEVITWLRASPGKPTATSPGR